MEYDLKILKNKIEDYFDQKITQKELIEWLRSVYSDFLLNGFLELKSLCIYPLLSRLYTAFENDREEENIKTKFFDSEINYVYSILSGDENKVFFYRISLPWKYNKMNQYNSIYFNCIQLKSAIEKYISGNMEKYNEIKKQIKTFKEIRKSENILDLLEIKIRSLAEEIFSDDENDAVQFDINYLYPDINYDRIDKRLLSLLSDYIDCILGEKIIIAEVIYLKGNARINIYCDNYN
ncbi:MAG: hypothetical protein J1E40_00435 [Oscillospiraceae bacterium]|nr:hypothetical protein [Oscillospiraceae bacterium]